MYDRNFRFVRQAFNKNTKHWRCQRDWIFKKKREVSNKKQLHWHSHRATMRFTNSKHFLAGRLYKYIIWKRLMAMLTREAWKGCKYFPQFWGRSHLPSVCTILWLCLLMNYDWRRVKCIAILYVENSTVHILFCIWYHFTFSILEKMLCLWDAYMCVFVVC